MRKMRRQIACKAVRRALCSVSFFIFSKRYNFKITNIYLISGKSSLQNAGAIPHKERLATLHAICLQ
ncbi:hypothetical protein, partial [uncultured Ruminococcus sp.]|uniref:hypothetical protein n=1 Tax=uncultured Ruminococcus sp. TaxID=165186 RepID=UPI0026DCDDDB